MRCTVLPAQNAKENLGCIQKCESFVCIMVLLDTNSWRHAMGRRQLYSDRAAYAGKRGSSDDKLIVGRKGRLRQIRCYHLTSPQLVSLRRRIEREGRFVSPYGVKRLNTMVINAFVECGTDTYHPLYVVFDRLQTIMSVSTTIRGNETTWHRFFERAPKNEHTHLPPLPRFLQTIEFLQRLGGNHPIGLKLAQLGACFDVIKDSEGMLLARLRTGIPIGDMVQPINTNRVRRYTKTVNGVASGSTFDVVASTA